MGSTGRREALRRQSRASPVAAPVNLNVGPADRDGKEVAEPEIYWKGQSGREYGYWIHRIGTEFVEEPGNYIYAKETRSGYWRPVYIGQTSNLKRRLAGHNEEECARRNGATHIHAHTSSRQESVRETEEKDLIKKWKPVCNEHYV
jgi:predicted GIY-YIG superfamily endonuclease